MHALLLIQNACLQAMQGEQDNPGGFDMFRDIVDPESVWEMARIIDTLLDRLALSGVDPELVTRMQQQLRGEFSFPNAPEEE